MENGEKEQHDEDDADDNDSAADASFDSYRSDIMKGDQPVTSAEKELMKGDQPAEDKLPSRQASACSTTAFVTPATSLSSAVFADRKSSNGDRKSSSYSERSPSLGSRGASTGSFGGTGFRGGGTDLDLPDKIFGATAETFQVRSVLGKGSFGTVYKVAEKSTGRSFAMKVLQKEPIFSKGILRYAVTEKNVQSQMNHPFIVALVCAFQTSHELVLVMSFCGGGTLEKLVKAQGGLPEEMARLYFAEVFLAIEHLHAKDVAYRDLKCENVVLDEQGHAMLTDFGLSKENIVGREATDTFVGSVAFIPPEILNSQRHGKPVDVYGLGVILYEMLTTLPPFYTDDKEEMFQNIKTAPLNIPSFVSEHCGELLKSLLDRDPANRPSTSTRSFAAGSLGIRHHPWMEKVDFDAVMRRDAPVMKPPRGRPETIGTKADVPRPFQPGMKTFGGKHKVDGWEFPLAPVGGALGSEAASRCGCFRRWIGIEDQ